MPEDMIGQWRAHSVDIVVPTHNNLALLQMCLTALEDQTFGAFHVWVCVDGSTDGTLGWLRAKRTTGLALTVLEHHDHANHGRSATRNLALGQIAAEHVLFLDSDVILDREAVEAHVSLLEREDVVSIGRVDYANAGENLWARYVMTRGARKARPGARVRPLDLNTQNAAMRSARFVASGGFDEALVGWGGEDIELGLRLSEAGAGFVFNAAARGVTREEQTVAERLAALRVFGQTNLPRIVARHPDASPYGMALLRSTRWQDRFLRAALNPANDSLARAVVPLAPFVVQRRLLTYLSVRAVQVGYCEAGGRSET